MVFIAGPPNLIVSEAMRKLYWIFTAAFLVPLAGTGVLEVLGLGPPGALENVLRLGYPAYVLPYLGGLKILGAIAIAWGHWPRLKEWAYAGFVFLLLGAIYSHLMAGDRTEFLPPLAFLLLVGLSYKTQRVE